MGTGEGRQSGRGRVTGRQAERYHPGSTHAYSLPPSSSPPAKGVFFNFYFITYMISPKYCHAAVGYLEEEAVLTYTHLLGVRLGDVSGAGGNNTLPPS